MFTDFSKDPKYTTVVLRNASAYQDAYSYQSLVTADESHLITLELSSSKETQIYIYRFRDNLSGQLTDKTLLYQSTDPIHDIRITPDNRFIILRTVLQEGDSYSASINRGEGGEYGDVDVAGKDYNYSIEDSYKITILEL